MRSSSAPACASSVGREQCVANSLERGVIVHRTAGRLGLIACLALVACRRPESRVLVLSAFPDELAPLLDVAHVTEQVRRDGRVFHLGVIEGNRVILALTGVGVDRAREATQDAIAAWSVSAIVFVGIAGGIEPGLGVGDVVVPGAWARHDAGRPTWYPVSERLAALVPRSTELDACARRPPCAGHPQVRQGGYGVSGARFIADPAYGEELWRVHAARVVDMETSAVADVASANKLPFIAFRAVSDVVSTGDSHGDIDEFGPLAITNATRAALGFFEHLAAQPR
jgi:adenosylhomocysteine nucleosidase